MTRDIGCRKILRYNNARV